MRFFLTIAMIVFLQTTHVVSSGLDDFSKALDPSLNSKEAKDLYQSALDSNDLPLDTGRGFQYFSYFFRRGNIEIMKRR